MNHNGQSNAASNESVCGSRNVLLYHLYFWKRIRDIILFQGLLLLLLSSCNNGDSSETSFENSKWWLTYNITAHAAGGMIYHDNENNKDVKYNYTNSREALMSHYLDGYRVFEVDVDFTSDGIPVLSHDWDTFRSQTGIVSQEITLTEFKTARIYGVYTTLSLSDLLRIMDDYTDIYVDLDIKNRSPNIWVPYLLKESQKYESDILSRIIVEFYNETNYLDIESIYHFSNYIYTVHTIDHLSVEGIKSITDFCLENSISLVGYPANDLTKEIVDGYQDNNIFVIAFNGIADDVNSFSLLKTMGVVGIQTDWVTQEMWDNN